MPVFWSYYTYLLFNGDFWRSNVISSFFFIYFPFLFFFIYFPFLVYEYTFDNCIYFYTNFHLCFHSNSVLHCSAPPPSQLKMKMNIIQNYMPSICKIGKISKWFVTKYTFYSFLAFTFQIVNISINEKKSPSYTVSVSFKREKKEEERKFREKN